MGSSSSKQSGIIVKIENPMYYPGEQVRGVVLLQISQPFPGININIKIKGQEQINYTEYGLSREFKKNIYKQQINLFSFQENFIPNGQYQFPFSFYLEDGLPGTFYDDKGGSFTTKIQYQLTASLPSLNSEFQSFEHKMQLIIRERPQLQHKKSPAFVQGSQLQIKQNSNNVNQSDKNQILVQKLAFVPQTLCFKKGLFEIQTELDKFDYELDKPVRVRCELDASLCKKDMKKIIFNLMNKSTAIIPIDSKSSKISTKSSKSQSALMPKILIQQRQICSYEFEGIEAFSTQLGHNKRIFDLEFNEFSTQISNYHKKSLSYRPSIYNSTYIKNQYFIQICFDFGSCCSKSPTINQEIQLQIPSSFLEKEKEYDIENNKLWKPKIFDRRIIDFKVVDIIDEDNKKSGNSQSHIESSIDDNYYGNEIARRLLD